MVLYRVYSQPNLDKYYSNICSRATLFQLIIYALLVIPPFFVAYSTREFWQYTSTYREKPDVNYLNRLLVQIGGENGSGVWSTFPNLDVLLEPEEITTPVIQSYEEDTNRDGRNDVLYLTMRFRNLPYRVQTVKFLLFFNLEFEQFASVSFHSLVYLSQSWAVPASRLWVGGALGLTQRVPFPASGRAERFNTSLLNVGGLVVEDFELSNILSAYNQRNVSTVLDQPLVAWDSGYSSNFTLEVEIQYPTLTVTYAPGFWQLIKFAWIQYLAIIVLFWWILGTVQSFVFQNQVILTIRKRGTKFHKQQ